jgi:hypothetical protein
VNTSIGVFNKTGTFLLGTTLNSLWTGASTPQCASGAHRGDPTILYDRADDRWIVGDIGLTDWANGPYYECIAVSQTGDPTGAWDRYAFQTDPAWLGDYPKMGLWPDALYMSANMFDCAGAGCSGAIYQGARVWAINLHDLVVNKIVRNVQVDLAATYFSVLPSNFRGVAPPAGSPNYLAALDYSNSSRLDVWKFQVDWAAFPDPTGTLTGPTQVTIASYTQPASLTPSIPQPPGGVPLLDSLGDRLMMQNQYRNIHGVESLWLTHTVVSGAATGIRWYQLNVTGQTIAAAPVQSSTFQPDTTYRWMPSLAVDRQGNMAIGYSVSSSSVYPGIRYTGRLATDALNTLGQGESTLAAGAGSQTTYTRWGDYSAMTVDPVDDCTFWYTNEYYAATGATWQTRIGSFKFPQCSYAEVKIAGSLMGTYDVAGDQTLSDSYPSLINGPVEVKDPDGQPIFTSLLVLSGAGNSDNELMGFPVNQFTTDYWFPWYDHGYPVVAGDYVRTWILVGNPSTTSTATVHIYIGGVEQTGSPFSVAPGSRVTPRWIGTIGGPVHLSSDIPVFASEREFTVPDNSFSEMMGFPANQFTTEYWFPWYDSVNMNSIVKVGNTSSSLTANVDIYIGTTKMGSYTVLPNQTISQAYAGIVNGPVRVVATNGIDIVTSQWTLSGPSNNIFNETMGYPFDQFTTEYWFPWYDHGYPVIGGDNMRTWILVGNPSSSATAHVNIYIGGVLQTGSPFSIAPGSRVTPRWIGTIGGPVHVVSDIPVFSSERVFTVPTNSFNEMMGYPANQLTSEYWFTWYDSVNMYNKIYVSRP